jgi:polyhydroxybutyrate depolymerase
MPLLASNLGVVLLTVASLPPAEKSAPGSHAQSLAHGGLKRTYRLYVPAGYDGSRPMPLVLVFHGGQGTGAQMERGVGFNRLADKHGFLVAYPDGVGQHWNDGRVSPRLADVAKVDDVGFVAALIDHLASTYRIDPDRVYATGISNGGFLAHRLGWELSDRLAAIAPVAGTLGKEVAAKFAPKRAVAVLHIHGTKDPAVKWEGGEVIARGGEALSVPAVVALWVKANGCRPKPTVEYLPQKEPKDGTRVRRETYAAGEVGAEVVVYAVEGWGHNWPGGASLGERFGPATKQVNGAEVIWQFFQRHRRLPP